ncbi:hypothetical protein KF840_07235 [bacterium]|nr:hypothetical protein [bacterium]
MSRLSLITVLGFLVACGFSVTGTALESASDIDLFAQTPGVVYALWPCTVDGELVEIGGDIERLDVFGLDRPAVFGDRTTYDRWFAMAPSFPFDFKENGRRLLGERLRSSDLVVPESVHDSEDSWGPSVSFSLKDQPDLELRRYPLFVLVITDRHRNAFHDREDYQQETKRLLGVVSANFLADSPLAILLKTLREPYASMKIPLLLATHIDDPTKFEYLMHEYDGADMTQYWTASDLVSMGVLPHVDHAYFMFNGQTFIAHPELSELVRAVVANKPPILPDPQRSVWMLQNPLSREIERVARFILFLHVVVPHYQAAARAYSCDAFDADLRALRSAESGDAIAALETNLEERLVEGENLEAAVRIFREKTSDMMKVLDDVPVFEKKGRGADDFVAATEGFRERHGAHLLESGLWTQFVKLALRYNLGPNVPYDTSRVLRADLTELDNQSARLERCLQLAKDRVERRLSLKTSLYSLQVSINQLWWSVLAAIVFGSLAAIFQGDLRRLAGDLLTWVRQRAGNWRRNW